ncbi:MAG TPA: TolC family protein [Paucimonas sp.]|nr:TolC family protein [Paucimonas sp.]
MPMYLPIRTAVLAVSLLALVWMAPKALAQDIPRVVPLTAQPDLKSAVDAAWRRSPQARTLEAGREEMAAGREAARSWIAGSPALGLVQRSDRWNGRAGARESEISLSAPVWLPGQMATRRIQAEAGADDLEARIAAARLAIAGEVRERLWAVVAAREALAEAGNRRQYLEAIAEEVLRRVGAGDLARTDGMLARQEALAARAAALDAEQRLREALSSYTVLTGLPDIPAAEPEPIAPAMTEPHPRLLAARAALMHARAALDVVDSTRSEPPTLGVALRRERDGAAAAASSSVTLSLEIPIGTAARNRPLETAARTRVESASAEAAQAEAALQAEIELARQRLAASQAALDAASSRATLARDHARLIERAFRLGERGLADMLRAQSLLHEAEAAERQQRAALGLAHARLNQALGIAP